MAGGDRGPAISRERLVTAALEQVRDRGLDGLTMRSLADGLGVKPASLYWHVRDRGELVELLARSLLAQVEAPGDGGEEPDAGWQDGARAVCAGVTRVASGHRDAARILLESLDVLERSRPHADLARALAGSGLPDRQAADLAGMLLVHLLNRAARPTGGAEDADRDDRSDRGGNLPEALVAIDSGSRGVTLRAGSAMPGLIRVAHDPDTAAPAVVSGDTVTVRRRRGVGQGELELSTRHRWRIKVQAPTWNTVLDATGLDLAEIVVDGGATRVDCLLPPPRGEVPITVAGGAVGVRLRRPPGVKVLVQASAGALQLRLDGRAITATISDLHWESDGPATDDHYLLRVSGGATRVTLEQDPQLAPRPAEDPPDSPAAEPDSEPLAALEIVLAGIAARHPTS